MTESQFGKHDVPLYTGRLLGLRSFAVVKDNKLAGITYPGRWQDGENEAKCALTDSSFYSDIPSMEDRVATPKEDHSLASLGCSCGFYAYFRGNENEYQHGVNVEGIIEAWGKLTIGTYGFRATKARIVALVIPLEVYPKTWDDKLAHRSSCPAPSSGPHGWSYPYLAHEAGCSLPLFPYPDRMEAIAANYPSAKLFNSMDDALAAFPPTPVEVANEIVGS